MHAAVISISRNPAGVGAGLSTYSDLSNCRVGTAFCVGVLKWNALRERSRLQSSARRCCVPWRPSVPASDFSDETSDEGEALQFIKHPPPLSCELGAARDQICLTHDLARVFVLRSEYEVQWSQCSAVGAEL